MLLAYSRTLPIDSSCRINEEDLVDAWRTPIYYGLVEGRLLLTSAGRDRQFATTDDLGMPERAVGNGGTVIDVATLCSGGG